MEVYLSGGEADFHAGLTMASPNVLSPFPNDLRMLSENSTGSSVARRSLMDSLKYA